MTTPNIIDSGYRIGDNSEGIVIESYQAIPDSFIQDLKNERAANRNSAAGDYHRVASIPVAVADKWIREGRDFDNASVKEIRGWLMAENLDAFITSDKAF